MRKIANVAHYIKRAKDYIVTWTKCDFPRNLWRAKITYYNWNLLQLRENINNKNAEYHKLKLSEIESRYSKIQIHYLFGNRIGECLSRLLDINSEIEDLKSDGNYHVFISSNPVGNSETFKLIDFMGCGEIVTEENLDFWEYVFSKKDEKIDFSQYARYKGRTKIYPLSDKPFLSLTEEQKKRGELEFSKFNLEYEEYVCFHARDSEYLIRHFNIDYTPIRVRDFDVNDFIPAMKHVLSEGMKAVRVGQFVEKKIDIDGVLDYANMNRSELMDLFLLSKCKYYIGATAGLNLVPAIFAIPKVIVNVDNLYSGGGSTPFTEHDSILPVKFLFKKENRLLTFEEMAIVLHKYGEDITKYEKNGITILHNSPEEILAATIELEKKMCGNYADDTESVYLQGLASEIIEEIHKKYQWIQSEHGKGYQCNISASFLKKNKGLFGDALKEEW